MHKDAKYIKVNLESKGNLVESFSTYTKTISERLNVFVVDLQSPGSESKVSS